MAFRHSTRASDAEIAELDKLLQQVHHEESVKPMAFKARHRATLEENTKINYLLKRVNELNKNVSCGKQVK